MATPQNGDPNDDAAMRARLKDLSGALDTHRRATEGRAQPAGFSSPSGMGQAVSLGFRVMSEFVAAVVVGGFIGWAIDRGLGSSPAALIVFLALGTAAGFWNVYRIAMRPAQAEPLAGGVPPTGGIPEPSTRSGPSSGRGL